MNKFNYLVEMLHFIPNSVQCLLKIAFKMIGTMCFTKFVFRLAATIECEVFQISL